MDIEHLIIETPFNGRALNCVKADGTVHFKDNMTAQQYMELHPGTRMVTSEEFNKMHEQYYTHPFKEITLEQWWEYFEQLPPLAARNLPGGWFVYFCLEAMSGYMHAVYVKHWETDKCYGGMMSRFATNEQILEKIKTEITDAKS